VPALDDWPAAAAALTAGLVSVLAFNLPFKLGLVVAALVGVAAGMIAEAAISGRWSVGSDQPPATNDQPPTTGAAHPSSFTLHPSDNPEDDAL
jgi:hypothetical protein